jgi:hypothetical protein
MNAFILNLMLERDLCLSSESLCTLCFIDYCKLISNDTNLNKSDQYICICLYSLKETQMNESSLVNTLNSKYPRFSFEVYNPERARLDLLTSTSSKQTVFLRDSSIVSLVIEQQEYSTTDTTLPSLVYRLESGVFIFVNGLSALYRTILKSFIKQQQTNTTCLFHFQTLLGYRSNSLKACSEVSPRTSLCEIVAPNALNKPDTAHHFFADLEAILASPLVLAHRNQKSNRIRKTNLQNSPAEPSRYFEDIFITIADLILFYYVSRIIEASLFGVKILQSYSSLLKWYTLMSQDINVVSAYLNSLHIEQVSKAILNESMDKTDSIIELVDKASNENDISTCNSLIDFNVEFLVYELSVHMFKRANASLCNVNSLFNLNDWLSHQSCLRLDWHQMSPFASPISGKYSQFNFILV